MRQDDMGPAPTIPMVEALRVKVIGRAVSPFLPPMVTSVDFSAEQPDFDRVKTQYKAYAEIGFTMLADEGAEDYVRGHAVKAICHHIFGPVERELRLVQEDLWAMGASRHSPASMRIDRLIVVLRGEQPPA